MVDSYTGVSGTYTAMSGVVNATGKAEIAAMIASLKALFTPAAGSSASHVDFSHMDPVIQFKLGKELDAMAAAIAASAST